MECCHVQDRLEAFVEGDLPQAEKRAVEDHIQKCRDCHKLWMEATEILGALRSLPSKRCPAHVVRDVMERTRTGPLGIGDLRSLLKPLLRPTWRPVVALALTAALLLVLLPITDLKPPEQPVCSEQEIQEAQEEIKWALAYVHRVMARTQSIVKEEVIPDQVVRPIVRPIRSSVNKVMESAKKGEGKS